MLPDGGPSVSTPLELLADRFDPAWDYALILPSTMGERLAVGYQHLLDTRGPFGEHFVLVGRPQEAP